MPGTAGAIDLPGPDIPPVVLQPLAVGAGCACCLLTAVLTVFMIAPAVDEMVATCQVLLQAHRSGNLFWHTFWSGVSGEEATPEEPKPLLHSLAPGMELDSIPWNLALCACLGVWLMVAPTVLNSTGYAANSNLLSGALVITFAVIGFGEAARGARWLNVPLGVWVVGAPWLLAETNPTGRWLNLAVGAAIIGLSLRRGPVRGRFGSWDRYVV